jgi:hypothetical protein
MTNVFEPLVIEIEVLLNGGVVPNVPRACDGVAFVLSARVFAPLVMLNESVDKGGAEKVPVACCPVPFGVMANVFPPLVIEIELLDVGIPAKVPRAVDGVALVVMVNAFEPLVSPIEVLVNGGFANVPVTFAAVPPLDRTRAFEPVVSEIVVLLNGVPEAVPTTLAPVPPGVRVRVFELVVTVIGLLVVRGALENVPVCVAAVGGLAFNSTLSMLKLDREGGPDALLELTVPVTPAPFKSTLQSFFRFCFGVGAGRFEVPTGPPIGALNRPASVAKPGAVANARCSGFRFITCIA